MNYVDLCGEQDFAQCVFYQNSGTTHAVPFDRDAGRELVSGVAG